MNKRLEEDACLEGKEETEQPRYAKIPAVFREPSFGAMQHCYLFVCVIDFIGSCVQCYHILPLSDVYVFDVCRFLLAFLKI